jgi:hypothetical protein
MSRGDGWSVAATLIAGGIAYFVGGAKAAIACIVAGVLIGLFLHFSKPKEAKKEISAATTADVRDSFNPTNSFTASPHIEQHVHLGGSHQKTIEQPSPPLPNLQCKPVVQDWLSANDGAFSRYQQDIGKQIFCGIAKLCNEPHNADISGVYRAKALIVFFNQQGGELGRSEPGTWIDYSFNLQNIPPGESKELLLYTRDEEQKKIFQVTNPNPPFIKYRPMIWHQLQMSPIHEPDTIARIELRILEQDGKLLATFVIPCGMVNGQQLIFGNPERIQAAGS